MRRVIVLLFVMAGVLGSLAAPDTDFDLYLAMYGGWSSSDSETANGTVGEYYRYPYAFSNNYDGSDHGAGGARFGIWGNWFGLAMDTTYFGIDSSRFNTSIDVLTLSVLLIGRYPMLVSDEFPNGRTSPYMGIGPAFTYAKIDTNVNRPDGTINGISETMDGTGLDLRAGWSWQFNRRFGTFLEYRYFNCDVDGSSEDDSFKFFPDEMVNVKTTITAHQLFCGFTYSF